MSENILERQEEVDEAHGSSHFFRGKRLLKFSFDHQVAFQRIVSRGAATLESATCLVFLCTLGDAEIPGEKLTGWDVVDMARGDTGIRLFRRRMGAWADENKIALSGEAGQECIDIATAIWAEIDVSKFTPEKKGSGGNALARPSGPSTSSKSQKSSMVRSRRKPSRKR